MGWSFRKSKRIGPFRINLSKSGVGWSVGGKGVRTGVDSRGRRYRSISIPGTGLRHTGGVGKSGCLVVLLVLIAALALAVRPL